MRNDPRTWWWFLGVFSLGTIVEWLEVARFSSDPYRWIGAVATTLGVLLAIRNLRRGVQ